MSSDEDYDKILNLSPDKLPPLFASPPDWFDRSDKDIRAFMNRWDTGHVFNFLKTLGFKPNQRKMDAENRAKVGKEKTCDVCQKKGVVSECGLCGEIYCSRSCLREAWFNPTQPHRRLCEMVVDNGRCYTMMNSLQAREKYTQPELNVAYGFPPNARPTSPMVTSVKPATPPNATKVSKETKVAQSVGSRCGNADCLRPATVAAPLKACASCKMAFYW